MIDSILYINVSRAIKVNLLLFNSFLNILEMTPKNESKLNHHPLSVNVKCHYGSLFCNYYYLLFFVIYLISCTWRNSFTILKFFMGI